MARENQGLQIALIVFVCTTLVFGALTYVFYRQADEAWMKAKANLDNFNKADNERKAREEDVNKLKGFIVSNSKGYDIGKMEQLFTDDLKAYAGSYAEEDHLYHNLIEKMEKSIRDKHEELASAKAEVRSLDQKFKDREASKDAQIKALQEATDKANADLAAERSKYAGERTRLTDDEKKLHDDLLAYRRAANAQVNAKEQELTNAKGQNKRLADWADKQARQIEGLINPHIVGEPAGEVVEVNQAANAVWINLGRADSLTRQVGFSVFPADLSNTKIEGRKGGIEVTRIVNDHLAEARIVQDKLGDPILPGDKIYTPLWNPGQKRHFALAGFFDIDGDGRSDLHAVVNLLKVNGCSVDVYIEDSGPDKDKVIGRGLQPTTNYLVLGRAPDDRSDQEQISHYSSLRKAADRLRIPIMQFNDMLQLMGWKNAAPVQRFGRGGNPNDFRAKPDANQPPKSTGKPSAFPKREPSGEGSSTSSESPAPSAGRYYRGG